MKREIIYLKKKIKFRKMIEEFKQGVLIIILLEETIIIYQLFVGERYIKVYK